MDIGSIKPWQTVLIGAVGLLALGKPVTGGKRFPEDLTITLPGIKTPGLVQVGIYAGRAFIPASPTDLVTRLLTHFLSKNKRA